MLTECPSCKTVFRVTGAILKMGHGQVRCGKCRKQFDAIECMLEDDDVENEENSAASSQQSPPSQSIEEETEHEEPASETEFDAGATYAEEVTMEGSRIEISGTYRMPGDDDTVQEKIVREHVVIDRGDLPSITTSGPDAGDPRNEDHDEETFSEVFDEVETELDLDSDDGEPVADAADHLLDEIAESNDAAVNHGGEAPALSKRWRRALHLGRKHEHEEIHAELHALTLTDRPRVLRTGVWATVCGLLVVMFVVQVIHHNRDALVRDPKFGNTVSRLYRAFGLSPTPHWDLSAYKWDIYKVATDPTTPDALRVVGSVSNNAPFAQPYPLGKLRLTDRWEATVGARAFEPYEYLRAPEAADRLMAPNQRTSIEIVIADPGPDAVGHGIYACLEQDRQLICADD